MADTRAPASVPREIKQGSNFISSENLFVSTSQVSHTNQHSHTLTLSLFPMIINKGANNGRVIVYFLLYNNRKKSNHAKGANRRCESLRNAKLNEEKRCTKKTQ